MKEIVNLGDLKQIMELQSLDTTTDEYGFHKEEWTTVLKTRCKIEFDKSYKLNKEVWKDDSVSTVSTRMFVFRCDPRIDVNIKQRVFFKNTYYQIYSVENINEENRFYRVWANTICQ